MWPTSVGQLGEISGVGEKKLATYGEGVIGVLAGLGEAPSAGAEEPAAVARESAQVPVPVQAQVSASAAGRAAKDVDPGADYWPEMDAEPEPEDWM